MAQDTESTPSQNEIIDLNIQSKIIKFLNKSIRENLRNLNYGDAFQNFLHRTPQT